MLPTSTLAKWGNSQGIILPKSICEKLGIKTGDKLSMEVVDGELRAKPTKDYTIQALLANYDGPKPEFEDYWGVSYGKEMR